MARPDRTVIAGPRAPDRLRRRTVRRTVLRVVASVLVMTSLGFAGARSALAADAPQMTVHVLLGGHTRVGSWLAIGVDLANDGPAITGELRLDAGSVSGAHYSVPVDLPTQSQKRYVLYAQPPNGFVPTTKVVLVGADGKAIADRKVEFTAHDPNQLLIGVIAEKPGPIVNGLGLQPGANGIAPAAVSLTPLDLPDRAEALAPLDRLVWQDVDVTTLSTEQLAALRAWISAGGRLVLVGGTGGAGALGAFPNDLLPYHPTTTVDVAPASLAGLLGTVPRGATDVPAVVGDGGKGRVLATSGGRPIVADLGVGSGTVTLVGFDPTAGWLGSSTATQSLWRRLLPGRTALNSASLTDDSQLVQAVYNLPSLTLPPVTGLLGLLVAYILLLGPINYLVLRRLDRREWAWITMPALIVLFAVGSYGYGSVLRGGDVVVNQIAVVRGASGSETGQARVYLGVFSPSRGTYQVSVPGGALLAGTISGEGFGGPQPVSGAIDVVQGEPARVRNLAVGYGSVRALRAESAARVPKITANLRAENGRLVGTVTNNSTQTVEMPAVVLGNSAVRLDDLAPGASRTVDLSMNGNPLGQSLSDRVVGQVFSDSGPNAAMTQQLMIRHTVIDQLTFDSANGFQVPLAADGPVLLGWGRDGILDVNVDGTQTRKAATVLYQVALPVTLQGKVAFGPDLLQSSVIASDAGFFNKGDPTMIGFGAGSVTMAYRPIGLSGEFTATKLTVALNFPGDFNGAGGPPAGPEIAPQGPVCKASVPCPSPSPDSSLPAQQDSSAGPLNGLPQVSLFDVQASAWRSLPALQQGQGYVVKDPARFVDPGSGSILVKFDSRDQNGVAFGFNVWLEGTAR